MDRQFHILRGASCRDVASSLVVAEWLMSINGKKIRFSLRLEIESNRDKISLDCFPCLRTINLYPLLFMKESVITPHNNNNNNSRRIATPNPRVSSK